MASLESVRQKIGHCEFHLNLVKAEIDRYLKEHPGEFVAHADSSDDRPLFAFRPVAPVPDKLGLLVGDCLQNLRSSLDYLVWELVLVSKNQPTTKNMFPICLTPGSFKDAQRGHRLDGISAESAALIDAFQPYRDGQPNGTCLAILDELTNTNKHRRLLFTQLSSFSIMEALTTWESWLNAGMPGESAIVHSTNSSRPITPEQMEMQGDLVQFVTFNEGAIQGLEVGTLIDTLVNYVNVLVDRFAIFF